jgi:hypothetical protein
VDPQPADGPFWDEGFAWAFEEPGVERLVPSELAGTAERIRHRREVLHARRLARSDAARRRRLRLYPLGAALAAAVAGLAFLTLRSHDPPAPRESPAATKRTPPAQTIAAPSVPHETANMRLGDSGEPVRALQQALVAIGFDAGVPDGSFAAKTRDAVAAFQAQAGVESDGVVGSQTALALTEALAVRASEQATTVRGGLADAAAAGRLPRNAAAAYGATLEEAVSSFGRMTLGRAANVALVLEDVAAHADEYTAPRALALFSMLEENAVYFASHDPPEQSADIVGKDAVVYRFFRSRGLQFHPIANFAALNRLVNQGKRDEAVRLAEALVARGVPLGHGLLWEYYFAFGGPPRWTSGFAQAVAADALSRTGALVGDDDLLAAARAAFLAIPGKLSRPLGGGMWIREYGFSDMPILNAQLQSAISLQRYAETASDDEAAAFAGEMRTAAMALLPRFDRGCWSKYSLDGNASTEAYHRYHVTLLDLLAGRSGEPIWAETARRWKDGC